MTLLPIAMAWLGISQPQLIPLDPTPTRLDILLTDQLVLVEDGSIIAVSQDYNNLYHWDSRGRLITTIKAGAGDSELNEIVTCIYDINRQVYCISDTGSQHCYFFDKQGQYLGKGVDQEGNDKFRLRQFIKTKGRTFAVDTARVDVWRNPDAPLINEFSFTIEESGKIIITRQGEPFCRITKEQRSMDYNLKRFWVVQDPYHQNLYVVDQLSTRIRHFVPNPRDDKERIESLDRQISFGLSRYVPPPQTWNTEMRTTEEFDKWWYSWSRINGFYHIEDGFVVGYDIPDSKLKDHCLLGLQKLYRNGKRIGKAEVLDGFFLGVRENRAYILLGPKQGRQDFAVAIHAL